MGLSASQARYLQLTSRKSDYEYRAQQINNSRLQLADKMQEISNAYSDGMSNRKMMVTTYDNETASPKQVRLDYNMITASAPEGLGYKLVNSNGTEVRPQEKSAAALRSSAEKKYNDALNNNTIFKTEATNEKGAKYQTKVTGENFKSLFQNDVVLDKDGTFVDMEKFSSKVSNMSATDLYKYWTQNEFQFASGTKLGEYQDTDYLNAAKIEYEEKMAEADKVENTRSIYDDRCLDASFLEEKLRNGEWTLQKINVDKLDEKGDYTWEDVHFSTVGQISDVLDTSDDAAVSSEYEAKMDYFSHKDKELELELQQIETSHSAIETEIDSVSKVIQNNVEKTFKTFG